AVGLRREGRSLLRRLAGARSSDELERSAPRDPVLDADRGVDGRGRRRADHELDPRGALAQAAVPHAHAPAVAARGEDLRGAVAGVVAGVALVDEQLPVVARVVDLDLEGLLVAALARVEGPAQRRALAGGHRRAVLR